MKRFLLLFTLCISLFTKAQSKVDYLKANRFDLNDASFTFPENDFKLIGFGAYHGSAKTEAVEEKLLRALTKNGTITYYLPETDYSTAYYYNRYLRTGDEELLKDLVMHAGVTVQQERTIESFNKWKALKERNDALLVQNKLSVVGVDIILTYKYTVLQLLELLGDRGADLAIVRSLCSAYENPDTDFLSTYNSEGKSVVRAFVSAVDEQPHFFENLVDDTFVFNHLIKNIKVTLEDFEYKREETIFNNYVSLSPIFQFDTKPQFMRIGFAHLEKSREGKSASFFTQLIEKGVHKKEAVISVIGYLTDSEVLWDHLYDDAGNYTGFTTEAGFGIGDYEDEYFRGIANLKAAKISDKTFFKLNAPNTPYNDGNPDLIEVILKDKPSNGERVKGKSTTEFLDYAVLISNSKPSTPIEERNR